MLHPYSPLLLLDSLTVLSFNSRQLWIWNLETPDIWIQPSAAAADPATLAHTAALALTRGVAEAMAQAIAAGWHSGMQAAARFGLYPMAASEAGGDGLLAGPIEQQVYSKCIPNTALPYDSRMFLLLLLLA